jgi:hypothetical protein
MYGSGKFKRFYFLMVKSNMTVTSVALEDCENPNFQTVRFKLVQKMVYDLNSLPYSDPALLTFTLTSVSLWILSIYFTVPQFSY